MTTINHAFDSSQEETVLKRQAAQLEAMSNHHRLQLESIRKHHQAQLERMQRQHAAELRAIQNRLHPMVAEPLMVQPQQNCLPE